ncbi:1,4-alpha-glucan branching protein [Streptomyces sp. NBC_00536]|uniref:maltokinase N-terminal cap-like domain-containing protein n=1 Tax=Streptomyces sp. NBC_00536 TaxID=2975769 RepID=UPI002E809B42|nr:1,4-alpha-glucan branching protein [Streptomyces sp. NBC_00536]WUC82258.1 1,4-alpha-glucan branching protein [Streptomyces sp. NBC_00536]
MAIIYDTTMNPGKLDLLAAWLPGRPWYVATGQAPVPVKAGGFRLDDPEGEVGIEFMVVTDTSGGRQVAYHVPVTYRGAPLEGAAAGLIGTSEHGVLGRRWVYDAAHDPVFVDRLLALFRGDAKPQHQSASDTPEPGVAVRYEGPQVAGVPATELPEVTEDARGTEILLPGGARLGLTRTPAEAADAPSGVLAQWMTPDGATHRGVFASLSFGPPARDADAGA